MFDLFEGATARREDWLRRVDPNFAGALHGQIHGPRAERAMHAPWTIFQRIDHADPAAANAQALEDLENGASGLTLVSARDLPRVLQGVALHAIALRVEGDTDAAALARLVATQPLDPEKLDISFGLTEPEAAARLADQGFRGALLEADGRPAHEQGATDAQELGVVLAQTVGILRRVERPLLGVTLAADQDMFATLAKFRAMRLLWAGALEANGLGFEPLRLHAETSRRMMATRDPHSNILRACAAVFGAALGGADSICVLPFSITQGVPNAFARRVARNVQNILNEESNLWRVADPASGSGYVEELTTQLCETAWRVFQATEHGEWPAFDASNARSRPVIGTSLHPLPTEHPAEVVG